MKKRLLLLPFVALMSFGLASCGGDSKDDSEDLQAILDKQIGPKEFEGYKRIAVPKDGKKYLLGYYNFEDEEMRFINGDQHHDYDPKYESVDYSFEYYLETTEDTTEDAAEVKVEYIDDTHFTLKVIAQNEDYHYHEKYLQAYEATSSAGRSVLSLKPVDEIEDDLGKFEVIKEVEGEEFVGVGLMYQDYRAEEEEEMAKLLGTKTEYVSVEVSTTDDVLSGNFCPCHFWEKK